MTTNALAEALATHPHRLYIFSFDILHPGVSVEVVTAYIRDARYISNWSYVNPGVYFLRSALGAHTMTNKLKDITHGARMVMAEINFPANVGGWLPTEAWNWLFENDPRAAATALLKDHYPSNTKS